MATAPSIISLKDTSSESAAAQARKVLRDGGIVAFPTETVYGLAIRGDSSEARESLFQLKNRDPNQQLARYVAHANQISASGITVNVRASKLMKAFWPGPLTVVIQSITGETHGFRSSSHPVAAMIGSDDALPILGTSANFSGSPPIADAATIIDTFGERIALTIDQGHPLAGLASSVVLLPFTGGFQMLREGDVAKSIIQSELEIKICLVCTGNTCRSPMAEVFLRDLLDSRDLGSAEKIKYTIKSAGTSAGSGMPASTHSQAVAKERGLDLSSHQSRAISARDLEDCDIILTMTRRHRDMLVDVLPECENRVRPLAGEDHDIVDPFGGDLQTYQDCADDIERRLKTLLEQL